MTNTTLESGTPLPADFREALENVPGTLFIDGTWTRGSGATSMPVHNPANGQTIAEVIDCEVGDGAAAATAAATAQPGWAATAARNRSDILLRAYSLILERSEQLARVMTLEMGKPLAEARGEVAYAADFFRWFAEEATRLTGDFTRTPDGRTRMLVTRQPVGPCLLITPWNFPLAMGARKIAPAIAAGCTMVLKPAPQTPLSSLLLTQILQEAGLPEGVLNVLTTSRAGEVVEPLLCGGVIRKLTFTGSTAVGRQLLSQCGPAVVRASMELGGNAPFIVFADADLDVAVESAMQAKMRNMGEACTAGNRFFAHRDVADQFTSRLAARMGALRVGPGYAPETEVGPLIDEAAQRKVAALVADALQRGARLVVGGKQHQQPGYFYQPTVLADVHPDSQLTATEIFGPVAAIQSFDDADDIVGMANDTIWGLAAYVFTQDIDRAFDVGERLEVGMVGLNTGIVSNPAMPFGGVKQSGVGREGGRLGIDEFLETKLIAMQVRQTSAQNRRLA